MQDGSDRGGMREIAAEIVYQAGDKVAMGAYCDSTLRIVVISPFPASLNALVMELTARCYDVLVFHHEHEPLLSVLQADLYILDRTVALDDLHTNDLTFQAKGAVISLVDPDFTSASQDNLADQAVIPWPSPVCVVLNKVNAIMSDKVPAAINNPHHLELKGLVLDLERMTVTRGEARIDLTKTEYKLLQMLIQAEGKVLSRDHIMAFVWGDQYFGGSNSVDVHVKSLRRKLGDDPRHPSYIATVRGVGYRIVDEVLLET
ncbi:MAG: winged helix-turn-helix domain-containing protein [Gorillibacterium sp.]|nr:winged helix-turn-helix domain-containing protein [Gorillibacterium sp.]